MADMYSDNPGGDEAAPTTASAGADTSESADNKNADEEGSEEFLVDKSALGGRKVEPGDRCTFECVKDYEDEYSFRYVKDGDTKENDNPEMDNANSEMDSMAQ